jgi:hypothetical protein
MTIYTFQVLVEDTVRNISKIISVPAESESQALERAKYSTHSDMIINKVTIIGSNK